MLYLNCLEAGSDSKRNVILIAIEGQDFFRWNLLIPGCLTRHLDAKNWNGVRLVHFEKNSWVALQERWTLARNDNFSVRASGENIASVLWRSILHKYLSSIHYSGHKRMGRKSRWQFYQETSNRHAPYPGGSRGSESGWATLLRGWESPPRHQGFFQL